MNGPLRNSALAAAASLGLLAGCTSTYPTADNYPPDPPPVVEAPKARSAAQYQDDASITSRVQAAVIGVPGIHANNIQVSTYDGVVTLRGTASHEEAARNAVQAARQVTGVRTVEYDLQVQPYQQVQPYPPGQPYQPTQPVQPYPQPYEQPYRPVEPQG